MAIDLTVEPERGTFTSNASARLGELRAALSVLQLRQTAHKKRLILIVEGWEATGRRALMRQVLASLDPCSTHVHCSEVAPIRRDQQHWLAEYWGELPLAGHSAVFYRSWYRRLVAERVERSMEDRFWSRGCDEINEFEAQQRDHDSVVVKLFLHCRRDTQAKRTAERMADPWQAQLVEESDPPSESEIAAWNALFVETDTRWAPWTLINAEHSGGGLVEAMEHLVSVLDDALPSDIPASGQDNGREDIIVDFPQGLVR